MDAISLSSGFQWLLDDLGTQIKVAEAVLKRAGNYTHEEDIQLCISWENISIDHIVGNEQPGRALIKHLFLDCPYARMVWRIIFYATCLMPPRSIGHMFDSWLSNQSKNIRNLIWVGVAAVCWAIWRCRNDIIFNNIKVGSILQVIFRGTYWLRFWAQLQSDEHAKNALSKMSRNIEIIAMELVKGGWKQNYHLQ